MCIFSLKVIVWALMTCVTSPVCMWLFNSLGLFDANTFNVHLQIYSHCVTVTSHCECSWPEDATSGTVMRIEWPCDRVHYVTSMYLAMIGVYLHRHVT